tara:strand:+ start:1141 stop:1374 length:234 start_codon:yes stop_codon:yes gene_type:complete
VQLTFNKTVAGWQGLAASLFNKQKQMEKLKLLQDYANSSDNTWLSIQLKSLEVEIYADKLESEERLKSYYNQVILKL